MNFREKLIDAYRKHYNPENPKQTFIKFRTRESIAIWSNDPAYNDIIIGIVNDKPIRLKNPHEIKNFVNKYHLECFETAKDRFTICIPQDTFIDAAMVVDSNAATSIDYVSDNAVFDYNGILFYTNTMNNDYLKDYLKHKGELK